MLIGLIYLSIFYEINCVSFYPFDFNLSCYATNTDVHSHAGLYILFLHCLRVIYPVESACVNFL